MIIFFHSFSLCAVIPNLVTSSDNQFLIAIPKNDKIKDAVFSMDPHSAPGLDGFPGSFYHKCWEIVKVDMVNYVQDFFRTSFLPSNFNANFITIIPKFTGTDQVSQFCPIALANFSFKIIPKILATRLLDITARSIPPQQMAFVKGRHIYDCVGLVSESVNLLDKKSHGGNVGCKIDIANVLNTVEWDFVLEVLRRFGFDDRFVTWVHNILHSARLSVLVNGTPYSYFYCNRGVRQGDPLSPFLFCFAKEVLSRGVPVFRGHPKRIHLQPIADNARAMLQEWKCKLLSMASRVRLVKFVNQSILLYTFAVYKWPVSLLKLLKAWARNFVWIGDVLKRKILTISWSKTCSPVDEGVANFIKDTKWCVPISFANHFPSIYRSIVSCVLPLNPVTDAFVWENSSSAQKIQTAKGNPGTAAYGAVFKSSEGDFIGYFAMKISCNTSFVTELSAFIHAIEIAYHRGWRMLWIESDSLAVLEGNCIADHLANIGLGLISFTWWDSVSAQIRSLLVRDACGLPNYRFSS
ncbi:hypothetical protein Dsin_009766 [Dipteronia sinensis]|uniref:Reverse transcriptase domain-containing protein n=1 Tax=Dipteronia sinensis TaxID=43782 RepID=A0AAE0EC15_9ROSI|nr:hypothetical protein Dsin_009766 [Dipteronia sinensis]